MINPISTSVSGLLAAGKKAAVTASNIANASTSGSLDPQSPDQPYAALTSVDKSTAGGGVETVVLPRQPAFVPSYAPDSPFANEKGLVGVPNINIEEEMSRLLLAEQAYAANAKVIRAEQRLHDSLMDALDK